MIWQQKLCSVVWLVIHLWFIVSDWFVVYLSFLCCIGVKIVIVFDPKDLFEKELKISQPWFKENEVLMFLIFSEEC